MNKELLKHYTEKAEILKAEKLKDLHVHLQTVKNDPNVQNIETRFVWDVLFWCNYPNGCRTKARAIMDKDTTLNDGKINTIMRKAFNKVFAGEFSFS